MRTVCSLILQYLRKCQESYHMNSTKSCLPRFKNSSWFPSHTSVGFDGGTELVEIFVDALSPVNVNLKHSITVYQAYVLTRRQYTYHKSIH